MRLIRSDIQNAHTRKNARTHLYYTEYFNSVQIFSFQLVNPWVLKDEMHLTDYPLTRKMAVKLLDISAKMCYDKDVRSAICYASRSLCDRSCDTVAHFSFFGSVPGRKTRSDNGCQ